MPAIPGAVEALHALATRHEVVIVTARGGSAFEHTTTWLRRAGVLDALHSVVSSHGDLRLGGAVRLGLDVVLDDLPANFAGLPIAAHPVLWSAAHNADHTVSPPVRRVHGWGEFTSFVDGL